MKYYLGLMNNVWLLSEEAKEERQIWNWGVEIMKSLWTCSFEISVDTQPRMSNI